MLSITRRVFAGLGALLPLALVAKETKDAKDDSTAAETEEVDVLVIGSGAAGLSAALAAKEAGAKRVLVIEKMPVIGGNARLKRSSQRARSQSAGTARHQGFARALLRADV